MDNSGLDWMKYVSNEGAGAWYMRACQNHREEQEFKKEKFKEWYTFKKAELAKTAKPEKKHHEEMN